METLPSRQLTKSELEILAYIHDLYGDHVTAESVFISNGDEAIIFVKDSKGTTGLVVNLTNVAQFAKLDNLNREEICQQYLI